MRMTSLYLAAAVTAIVSIPTASLAQIELVPVVSGLSSPVFVGHAGDNLNRLFIVEQAGIIKVLQPRDRERWQLRMALLRGEPLHHERTER